LDILRRRLEERQQRVESRLDLGRYSPVRFSPDMAQLAVPPPSLETANITRESKKKKIIKRPRKERERKRKTSSVNSQVQTEIASAPPRRQSTDSYQKSLLEQKKALSEAQQKMDHIEQLTQEFTSRNSAGGRLSAVSFATQTYSPREDQRQSVSPTEPRQQRVISPIEEQQSARISISPKEQPPVQVAHGPPDADHPLVSSRKESPRQDDSKSKTHMHDIQVKFEEFMAKRRKSPTEPQLLQRTDRYNISQETRPIIPGRSPREESPVQEHKSPELTRPYEQEREHIAVSSHPEIIEPASTISSPKSDRSQRKIQESREISRSSTIKSMSTTAILSSYERSENTTRETTIETKEEKHDEISVSNKDDEEEESSISVYSITSMSSIDEEEGDEDDEVELQKRVAETQDVSTEDVSIDDLLLTRTEQEGTDSDEEFSFSFLSDTEDSDVNLDDSSISSLLSVSSEASFTTKDRTAGTTQTSPSALKTLDSISESTLSPQLLVPLSSGSSSITDLSSFEKYSGIGSPTAKVPLTKKKAQDEYDSDNSSILSSVPSFDSDASPTSSILSDIDFSHITGETDTTTSTTWEQE
jgi:hypothetical protein